MLKSGTKLLNRFGFEDPVTLYDCKNSFYTAEKHLLAAEIPVDPPPPAEQPKREVKKEDGEEDKEEKEEEDEQKEEEKQEEDTGEDRENEEEDDDEEKKKKVPKGPEKSYPVTYNHMVVFFSTEDHRARFIENPRMYLNQEYPPPSITPALAVIGMADDQFISNVSQNVGKSMRCVYLNMNEMIEREIKLESDIGIRLKEDPEKCTDELKVKVIFNNNNM